MTTTALYSGYGVPISRQSPSEIENRKKDSSNGLNYFHSTSLSLRIFKNLLDIQTTFSNASQSGKLYAKPVYWIGQAVKISTHTLLAFFAFTEGTVVGIAGVGLCLASYVRSSPALERLKVKCNGYCLESLSVAVINPVIICKGGFSPSKTINYLIKELIHLFTNSLAVANDVPHLNTKVTLKSFLDDNNTRDILDNLVTLVKQEYGNEAHSWVRDLLFHYKTIFSQTDHEVEFRRYGELLRAAIKKTAEKANASASVLQLIDGFTLEKLNSGEFSDAYFKNIREIWSLTKAISDKKEIMFIDFIQLDQKMFTYQQTLLETLSKERTESVIGKAELAFAVQIHELRSDFNCPTNMLCTTNGSTTSRYDTIQKAKKAFGKLTAQSQSNILLRNRDSSVHLNTEEQSVYSKVEVLARQLYEGDVLKKTQFMLPVKVRGRFSQVGLVDWNKV